MPHPISVTELVKQIDLAEKRIRPFIRQTPLEFSPFYSEQSQCGVYFKYEILQHTGSFKARGAFNKILSLPPERRANGVITASTGNHGAAVAFALRQFDMPGIVFVPESAGSTKLAAIKRMGVELRKIPGDPIEAEKAARLYASENDMPYISPYNNVQVIAGQGTIGLEMIRQMKSLDAVMIPTGGGGLISGVAACLKSVLSDIQIVGCLPENSPVMQKSVEAKRALEMDTLPTLSDATAGGLEADSITLPLCQQLVDDFVTVSEEEIAFHIKQFIETQHTLIEGAAAVGVAGLMQKAAAFKGKRVAVILCGANISTEQLKSVL